MEVFTIKNLGFSYPNNKDMALDDINISIKSGEFFLICGSSGCGKSTFLRHLKTDLTPFGDKQGEILFSNQEISTVDRRTQSSEIGFVLQSAESQIVTDKVWHELAFGLESLALDQQEIRLRVAEMASFFGIQNWFHKKTSELSGGQKQILNLASIMLMQPKVLILDEPTSQLDPLAAADFLQILNKINKELAVTIIISEHRLEEVFPMSDRVLVLENGKVLALDEARKVGELLFKEKNKMFFAMPSPMLLKASLSDEIENLPLTVKEAKDFLRVYAKEHKVINKIEEEKDNRSKKVKISAKELYFRYEKDGEDVVKGLSLKIYENEIYSILGGNGTGKSTAISLMSGLIKPLSGDIKIDGIAVDKNKNLPIIGLLPQNPEALFVCKTVEEDLYDVFSSLDKESLEAKSLFCEIVKLCEIENLLNRHPFDISGGEKQRVALAKVLLREPDILFLDEPTKGMDAYFKLQFSKILKNLKDMGKTIVIVSHDIEFCSKYADSCGLFFDGDIVSEDRRRTFFNKNSFYTTQANRIARDILEDVITIDDIAKMFFNNTEDIFFFQKSYIKKPIKKSATTFKLEQSIYENNEKREISKRTKMSAFFILLLMPLTIYLGIFYLDDRKYYFISLLIMLETFIPFILIFEDRKPQARELIIIAVLSGIAVSSRMAFFWLPQFKPLAAIVIISAIAFGAETGFLVGAISAFVSNYFFGQGPWTPWQMFSFGIIGFLAGILFQKELISKRKYSMAIYGFLSTFLIYGFLMNTASVLISQAKISISVIALAILRGLPFDLIHAASTAYFIVLFGEQMLEKLERVKEKYGLIKD